MFVAAVFAPCAPQACNTWALRVLHSVPTHRTQARGRGTRIASGPYQHWFGGGRLRLISAKKRGMWVEGGAHVSRTPLIEIHKTKSLLTIVLGCKSA